MLGIDRIDRAVESLGKYEYRFTTSRWDVHTVWFYSSMFYPLYQVLIVALGRTVDTVILQQLDKGHNRYCTHASIPFLKFEYPEIVFLLLSKRGQGVSCWEHHCSMKLCLIWANVGSLEM
jgi:hypothetical protein